MQPDRLITLCTIAVTFGLTVAAAFSQSLESALGDRIDIVVAPDGSGNYTTVQEAINAIPDNNPVRKVIFVKNGIYKEKLIVPWQKTHVTLVGEDVDYAVITCDDASVGSGDFYKNTFNSHSVRVDADWFEAINLTISNTNTTAQAVALHGAGDCQMFLRCRIKGWQDTYFNSIRTRNYFKDCVMEGGVDYLFGFGIALFDSCLINTIRDGGYMTAAATSENYKFGFMFMDCNITNSSNVNSFYLGRPWFAHSNTVLFKCRESGAVRSEGWKEWSGREATCYYREYKCTGPGSDFSGRVGFGKQLTDEEAESYTIDSIFSASAFPQGEAADTFETNTILRRFENSSTDSMVAIARIFMKCGRDTFPPYPEFDWHPQTDTNPIFSIVRSTTVRLLDSTKVAVALNSTTTPYRKDVLSVRFHPLTNRLTVHGAQAFGTGSITLALFAANGRLVLQRTIRATQRRNTVSWNVSSLDQGVYCYRVYRGGAVYSGMVHALPGLLHVHGSY